MKYLRFVWKIIKKYWEVILGIIIGFLLFRRKKRFFTVPEIKDNIDKEIKEKERENRKLKSDRLILEKKREEEYRKAEKMLQKIDGELEKVNKIEQADFDKAKEHIKKVLEK